jgi:hypothetical protein
MQLAAKLNQSGTRLKRGFQLSGGMQGVAAVGGNPTAQPAGPLHAPEEGAKTECANGSNRFAPGGCGGDVSGGQASRAAALAASAAHGSVISTPGLGEPKNRPKKNCFTTRNHSDTNRVPYIRYYLRIVTFR